MAKTTPRMGPKAKEPIMKARRAFFLNRGIDLDTVFKAQTVYDLGGYTGEVSHERLPNSAEFVRWFILRH